MHNIIHHSDQEIKINTSRFTKDSKIFTRTRTFGIIPQEIINDMKLIIPNSTTKAVKFPHGRHFRRKFIQRYLQLVRIEDIFNSFEDIFHSFEDLSISFEDINNKHYQRYQSKIEKVPRDIRRA